MVEEKGSEKKRGRGRPPLSKNKPKPVAISTPEVPKRKRGRPPLAKKSETPLIGGKSPIVTPKKKRGRPFKNPPPTPQESTPQTPNQAEQNDSSEQETESDDENDSLIVEKIKQLEPQVSARFGEVVWARMAGFPFWPGIIFNPQKLPSDLKEVAAQWIDSKYWVYYYGSDNFAPVVFKSVVPWESTDQNYRKGFPEKRASAKKRRELLMDAIKIGDEEFALPVEKRVQWLFSDDEKRNIIPMNGSAVLDTAKSGSAVSSTPLNTVSKTQKKSERSIQPSSSKKRGGLRNDSSIAPAKKAKIEQNVEYKETAQKEVIEDNFISKVPPSSIVTHDNNLIVEEESEISIPPSSSTKRDCLTNDSSIALAKKAKIEKNDEENKIPSQKDVDEDEDFIAKESPKCIVKDKSNEIVNKDSDNLLEKKESLEDKSTETKNNDVMQEEVDNKKNNKTEMEDQHRNKNDEETKIDDNGATANVVVTPTPKKRGRKKKIETGVIEPTGEVTDGRRRGRSRKSFVEVSDNKMKVSARNGAGKETAVQTTSSLPTGKQGKKKVEKKKVDKRKNEKKDPIALDPDIVIETLTEKLLRCTTHLADNSEVIVDPDQRALKVMNELLLQTNYSLPLLKKIGLPSIVNTLRKDKNPTISKTAKALRKHLMSKTGVGPKPKVNKTAEEKDVITGDDNYPKTVVEEENTKSKEETSKSIIAEPSDIGQVHQPINDESSKKSDALSSDADLNFDITRRASIQMFQDVINKESNPLPSSTSTTPDDPKGSLEHRVLCEKLEKAIFQRFESSDEDYKKQIRLITFWLEDSKEARESFISGSKGIVQLTYANKKEDLN